MTDKFDMLFLGGIMSNRDIREKHDSACPICGCALLSSEKIEYGGMDDCRVIPLAVCSHCGWKRRDAVVNIEELWAFK